MYFRKWWSSMSRHLRYSVQTRSKRRQPVTFRPQLESLEERTVPSSMANAASMVQHNMQETSAHAPHRPGAPGGGGPAHLVKTDFASVTSTQTTNSRTFTPITDLQVGPLTTKVGDKLILEFNASFLSTSGGNDMGQFEILVNGQVVGVTEAQTGAGQHQATAALTVEVPVTTKSSTVTVDWAAPTGATLSINPANYGSGSLLVEEVRT